MEGGQVVDLVGSDGGHKTLHRRRLQDVNRGKVGRFRRADSVQVDADGILPRRAEPLKKNFSILPRTSHDDHALHCPTTSMRGMGKISLPPPCK